MAVSTAISALNRFLARAEDLLLILLLAAMVALSGAQILLRNLWDAGFAWSDPLLRMAVLWLALAGAVAASRRRRHIRIDILSRLLPRSLRRAAHALTDLFTAGVCGLLAWHGARFVHLDRLDGIEALPGLPAWVVELAIPVGFTLIALRYLAHAFSGRSDGEAPG